MATARATFVYFVTFIALNASANEDPGAVTNDDTQWYQIEYIIFEHLQTDDHILRYEDTPYPSTQNKQYTYLTTNPYPISPYQFTLLNSEEGVLTTALRQLNKSKLVHVLDTGAWQQTLSTEFLPAPLRINKSVSKERQLFGELQLTRSRYTHAEFKLYLTKSMTVPFKNIIDWFVTDNTQWRIIELLTPIDNISSTEIIGTDTIYTDTLYLGESRRIKEGEIHYIDHPVFSVIITIKGAPSPEHLNNYVGYTGE